MKTPKNFSDEDIMNLIYEEIEDLGITPGEVQVSVQSGTRITLKGEVRTEGQREELKNYIVNIVGIADIVDELVVEESEYHGFEEKIEDREHEMYDEDKECIGTDDVFQSVEDGLPYIPPTSPPVDGENFGADKKKRKRKKRD